MSIKFTPETWADHLYWQKHDKEILKYINLLINNVCREPFAGIGKPETLKHELQGCWPRRNQEHRLIYQLTDGTASIVSVRYHSKPF